MPRHVRRRHRVVAPILDFFSLLFVYLRSLTRLGSVRLLKPPAVAPMAQAAGQRHGHTDPRSRICTSLALRYYKGKTIVLDLDETLVHSVQLGMLTNREPVHAAIQRKRIEVLNDRQSIMYEVYKRPHVDFFLKMISQWYRIVIFTASMADYADPVIDWLDQGNHLVDDRFFRQSCVPKDGGYIKDISLAEPDLSKVCLIDNCPMGYNRFQENGVPIQTWLNSPTDQCLLDLLPLLDALRFTSDVRNILRLRRQHTAES